MQMPVESVWTEAQKQLASMTSNQNYNLWFAPIKPVSLDEDCFTLEVANEFSEFWLKDNYMDLLQKVLSLAARRPLRVSFQITPPEQAKAPNQATRRIRARSHGEEPVVAKGHLESDVVLNPMFTFDTFVVGNNSTFAHAAAMAVAQSPGRAYNPLFVYGGVGLGKTHLLHAIGQHALEKGRGYRVAYVSSEKFTNEYIDAIQNNQTARFRKRYRLVDVLLIDDVQFLAGKERIQEEFFHTFNALHEAGKQIVMTCDRPASELRGLESRLVSRFEWGLVTDLQPPDMETRLAILNKKARALGMTATPETLNFIAEKVHSNIRKLEGALTRVHSYTKLVGRTLTIEQVMELLKDVVSEESRPGITIEVIIKKVAEHYDIRVGDIMSKRRPENIAFPRQVAMYLSRNLTHSSFNAIGEAFGRDHGTVLHACRAVQDRIQTEDKVKQDVGFLERQLLR